jgi:hypothetical protein
MHRELAGWIQVRAKLGLSAAVAALMLPGCGSEETRLDQLAPLAVEREEGALNEAPVIRAIRLEPHEPVQGDRIRAVVSVHDPEGDEVELVYRWRVDGDPVVAEGAVLELVGVDKGARIEVVVVASDGRAESDEVVEMVTVIDRAPVLNGIAIQPTDTVYPGDSVVVTPTGSDPDGDRVDFEFEWLVNGERVDGDSRSFSTAGLSAGDRIRVRVVATDGSSKSVAQESVDVTVGSAHPEIVSSPPGITDDGVFRYAVEARDPDGDRNLRYRLAQGPEGMSIDEVLGQIEWRPAGNQTGVHQVSVVVRDSSRLETTQSFQVTVSASGGEAPAAPSE